LEGDLMSRSRRTGILALVSLGVAVASTVALCLGFEGGFLGLYALYPFAIALAMHLTWTGTTRKHVQLEASGRSLRANGVLLRSHLASAKILPQPHGRAIVELRRRFDPYAARVELASEEARVLVRTLGFDPREGTTRFAIPFVSLQFRLAFVFVLTLVLGITLGTLPWLAPLLIAPFWLVFSHRTVTIGSDGILIEDIFPRRRFIPYSSVASIDREERHSWRGPMVSRGFYVSLHRRKRIYLHTMHERFREGMVEGDYLYDAAGAAHRAAVNERPTAIASLLRAHRSAADWLRGLRTLRQARYRVAAVPDEELLSVLRDPSADKAARAGAAVCLAGAGDDARAKVRIAAEDVAAPDLRAAIDAALSDDEETLERKLAAL
jgi:hypothetical protein